MYGAYFVDRPPLLIGLYSLANALGGAVPLRLLGVVAVVAAVMLAGRLGGTPASVLCAALVSSPLFDGMEIDGELLAVPFVLGAFVLLARSRRNSTALGAGVLAMSAVLVKQNMIDGLVVAAVLLIGQRTWTRAAAYLAGGGVTLAVALLLAHTRGTDPGALWDALVTFRAEAAAVIDASSGPTTSARLHEMLWAGLVAGVPLVAASAVVGRRRPIREPLLLWAAVAALAWESAGALLGGSYWRHYLLALVPGLVLLVVAGGGRWVRLTVGYAAMCAGLAWVVAVTHQEPAGPDDVVAAYVHLRARPGDTMVVAFGHPDIVRDAGLPSPYQHLWSLSARVRDPRLDELGALLRGPDAPHWAVVDGDSLATWGIDAHTAQLVLDNRYREVTSDGDWHVFEHR